MSDLEAFLRSRLYEDEAIAQAAALAEATVWYNAPKPRRWHRCQVTTSGRVSDGTLVERCPCGGIRLHGDGPWMERNSRDSDGA